jgi:hypothetical protein
MKMIMTTSAVVVSSSLAAVMMVMTSIVVDVDAVVAVPASKPPRYSPIQLEKSRTLRADSELGQTLISNARRVEDNNNQQQQQEEQGGVDMTWITDYAIKFQGCHFVQQFVDNDEEGGGGQDGQNGNNNNVVQTKSLVRFRLCPNDTCNDSKDGGCSNKYGEYIIGLDTFVNVYYEHRREMEEYQCEMYLQEYCNNCDGENNNQGDDFNEEQCQYDCYVEAGKGLETMCMDRNPYEDNNNNNNNGNGENQEEGFEIERYMECAEYEFPQNNNNNGRSRRLEQQGDEGSGLFIGPYCAEQGGAIYIGMFTDEKCTEFADNSRGADTFAYYEGTVLPYATESIVTPQCVSCFNVDQDGQDNNDANNDANGQIAEVCQEVYQFSGKCEQNLPSGLVEEVNNNACSYIQGIQTVRKDGMIGSSSNSGGGASTAFIVLLCVVIFGLAFYVHYLRTKIARRFQRINDSKQPLYPTEEMYAG